MLFLEKQAHDLSIQAIHTQRAPAISVMIPLRTSCGLQRGLHGLEAMSASASAKKTHGELVEDALQQHGDTSSLDLIDIGINLADPSFDQVGPPPTNVRSTLS